ncbi:sigma factor [Streptomyces sp. NPDC058086]|uniref:sigma factor n=1 Tax=Streptomyces sp. NPDC058086 TaxID=3346334 RepID=UPI0036E65375
MTRTEEFEQLRPLLFSIAYRILGSVTEAEDAVQETWLRYELSPTRPASAKAFLSAVVTRISVDVLRSARLRREEYVGHVSSAAGSLTLTSDPDGPPAALPTSAAYAPSKTALNALNALNALTVHYANELRKNGILINAADPGYVDTEINNHSGYLTAAQGAAVLVRLTTLGADGPTGGLFSEDGPVPW